MGPVAPSSRTIVITGATRGLGRALALECARAGHVVLGCGRSQTGVADLAGELGAPHDVAVVDVADDEAVARWAARLVAAHGAPALVINNAALMNDNVELWKVPAAQFDALVDVNIKGVANVLRHFLPAMLELRRGVVVNLSSGWGRSTDAKVAPYCATKWAIEGLTQALAQELPKGMCAVALNPGTIDTDMLRQCWAGEASSYQKPAAWAKRAAPFLLALGPKDNGQSLDVPR